MSDHQLIRLAHEPPFRLERLAVTPATRQVCWAGEARTLEPRVMQVLVALAGAQGAVVGRDDLVQRCWDGRVVGDNAINRVIHMLRQLGSETGAFSVETVTKVGYRLVATAAPQALEAASGRAGRRLRLAAAGGLAVVGLGLLAWWWFGFGPGGGASTAQNGRVEIGRFEVRQGDAELARLSAAIGDSLIRVLTRSGIDSAPEGAARGEIGAAAAPEFRVTGSVDRQGQDIVVNTQVLDRRSGFVLSSLQQSRPASASPGFADQAALSVAAGLDCALEDRKRSRRPMPSPLFSLYLNTCDAIAGEGNPQRMLESARRLVAAAPDLAVGHALYGIAQAGAADAQASAPAEGEALRRAARASAARALQLDPRTPKAYIAIANSYPAGSSWAERERNLLQARQIDPNLNPGRISYIAVLRDVGRLNEALEVAVQLTESGDPRTLSGAKVQEIFVHAELGDMDRARALLGQLERLDPEAAAGAGWIFASTWEDPAPALARIRALAPGGPFNPRTVACVETFLQELPQRLSSRARGLPAACDGVRGDRRVQMLAREGDIDGAYSEASRLVGAPDVFVSFLFYPAMKAFRADPRFMPLAGRFGLVDYWTRSGRWPDFCAERGLPYDCRQAARAIPLNRASR